MYVIKQGTIEPYEMVNYLWYRDVLDKARPYGSRLIREADIGKTYFVLYKKSFWLTSKIAEDYIVFANVDEIYDFIRAKNRKAVKKQGNEFIVTEIGS